METTTQFSSSNSTDLKDSASQLMIQWPFIIAGIYYSLCLAAFGVIYWFYPENTIHPSRKQSFHEDSNAKKDKFKLNKPLSNFLRIFVVTVATIIMHAYIGLEISFGSLLAPFANKSELAMNKSEGSFLTSAYWAAYTFLRVFSLIAIIYTTPRFLLLVNFGIIMFSNVFLFPFGDTQRWALWLGSGLMGLGTSSVFATLFA